MAHHQQSAASGGSSTDLSWLPSDAEEQLSLGFRIISNAYKTRVQSLEAEVRALKHQVEDKSHQVVVMQKKHSSLEVEMIEIHQRANQLVEENRKMATTITKLHREIQRLETLKQAVLSSIQEGDREEGDRIFLSSDYLQSAAPLTLHEMSGDSPTNDPFARYTRSTGDMLGNSQSVNQISPVVTGGGGSGTAGSNTTTQLPSPPNTTVIDGKQFFRSARNRLTYEQFNVFLQYIKKLNAHQQSREETLMQAHSLFGDSHRDLYDDFKALLTRHTQPNLAGMPVVPTGAVDA